MPAKQSLNMIHLLSEFITQYMPKYGHKLQKIDFSPKVSVCLHSLHNSSDHLKLVVYKLLELIVLWNWRSGKNLKIIASSNPNISQYTHIMCDAVWCTVYSTNWIAQQQLVLIYYNRYLDIKLYLQFNFKIQLCRTHVAVVYSVLLQLVVRGYRLWYVYDYGWFIKEYG